MALGDGKGKDSTFKMKHVRKFDSSAKSEAQKTMGMAVEQVSALNETAAQLSKVHIDHEGRLEFVEHVMANGNLVDAIVDAQDSTAAVSSSLLDSVIAGHGRNSREAREERIGRVGRAILEAIVN